MGCAERRERERQAGRPPVLELSVGMGWLAIMAGALTIATQASTQNASPEWMLTVRVYGSILYATNQWGADGAKPVPLEPRHIDAWMQECAAHGVTSILWRANCAGTLTYPSRFTALSGEPPLTRPQNSVIVGVAPTRQSWRPEDWNWLGEQCRRFNILEAAVKSAHRH